MSSTTAAGEQTPPSVQQQRSGRGRAMLALVIAIILAVLLPPYVNLKRFRARMETSIGAALGRRVSIGSATLRLLPRPGFDLERFVVDDDPAFSAEPILRADEVTASLRLTSLWKGRLEIASLTLRYPSLNVVRMPDGHWNVEALVTRASQVPAAPTALRRAESRPRFPYVEATGARINFKLDQEKTVFALSDADFSAWLARENEWELRLNARPIRTDKNLSDTGRIRVQGTVDRATEFRSTPVRLQVLLDRAQLGQLTTLIYGRDRGWRGAATVDATFAGTPSDLKVAAEVGVSDFRRYDIISGGSYDLRARCSGSYSVDTRTASDLQCLLPQGDGLITLRGKIVQPLQERSYDIGIDVKDVPMQELVRFAQHSKRDLPTDLSALGTVDASFLLRTIDSPAGRIHSWTGGGSTRGFGLRSRALEQDLAFSSVKFSLQPPPPSKKARGSANNEIPADRLVLETFTLPLGGSAPASIRATVTRANYDISLEGDATLAALERVADGLGIPIYHPHLTGNARLNIDIVGTWAGFGAPLAIGNLQWKDVSGELPGVAGNVRIPSALVSLAPDRVSISSLSVTMAGGRMAFDGGVSFPRRCDLASGCTAQFDLHAGQLSTDDLNLLLNPGLRSRPWYKFGGAPGSAFPAALKAQGRITVGRLVVKTVTASRVSAQVRIADRHLTVSNLQGEIFGGKHQGDWQADLSGNVPSYSGAGTLKGVSMALVSTAMRDNWAAGPLSATYKAALAGRDAAELLQSANGSMDFDWTNGMLRHIVLRGPEPLHFARFRGRAALQDGKLSFADSTMTAQLGIYEVSGSAELNRGLDLKFATRDGGVIAVSGTIQKPQVAPGSLAAASAPKP